MRIVGLAAPDWLPIRAGDPLSAELALEQRSLVRHEPWAIDVTAEMGGPFRAALAAHGIKALAYGPLVHGDHLDGGLIIATGDARFARMLVDKLPGVVSFSATSSALLAERLYNQRFRKPSFGRGPNAPDRARVDWNGRVRVERRAHGDGGGAAGSRGCRRAWHDHCARRWDH